MKITQREEHSKQRMQSAGNTSRSKLQHHAAPLAYASASSCKLSNNPGDLSQAAATTPIMYGAMFYNGPHVDIVGIFSDTCAGNYCCNN